MDTVSLVTKFVFKYASSGTYYIQLQHRNALETWSKTGGEPFTSAADNFYDFTTSAAQAFGNNTIQVGSRFTFYSGDVNKDGVIDVDDLIATYNDGSNFLTGYVRTDVNGDFVTDVTDLVVVYNNSVNFIFVIRP